jgi:hypothetical protein
MSENLGGFRCAPGASRMDLLIASPVGFAEGLLTFPGIRLIL